MDKKIAIELIKLEVLNRCNVEDSEAIQFLKHNDEDFPWKEHGDYQNMLAVLSLKPMVEMPKEGLRQEVIRKACELKNIIVHEEKSEELKSVSEESAAVRLHESESAEPGILPKVVTSEAGISLLEEKLINVPEEIPGNNEIKEFLEKIEEEFSNEPDVLNKVVDEDFSEQQKEEITEDKEDDPCFPDENQVINELQEQISEPKEEVIYDNITEGLEQSEESLAEDFENEFSEQNEQVSSEVINEKFSEHEEDIFTGIDKEEIKNEDENFNDDIKEQFFEAEEEVFNDEVNEEIPELREWDFDEDLKDEIIVAENQNLTENIEDDFLKADNDVLEVDKEENLSTIKEEEVFNEEITKESFEAEEEKYNEVLNENLSEVKKELFLDDEKPADIEDELVEIKISQVEHSDGEGNTIFEEDGIIEEEEFIEEIKNDYLNHENTKKATARLDDLILVRQPKLFKFQDIEDNHQDEQITEDELITNKNIEHVDIEKNLEVKAKVPTIKHEVKETVVQKEIPQPIPEPVKIPENKSFVETKADYEIVKESPGRNVKSYLIIVVALVVIIVPVIFFLSSSNEEVSNATEKTESNESFAANVEMPKLTNQVSQAGETQITEDVPVVEEELPVKESQVNKTELPPPLPEPVFAEPENLEVIEDVPQKNSEQIESTTIVPPKEEKTIESEPTYFVAVEEMPEPIGGIKAIQSKIEYPEIAKRVGIQGKVFVAAFVDETGNVTNVELLKGLGGGCDEEAMEAVRQTKFLPGKQRGKPVKVRISIPIIFKIESSK